MIATSPKRYREKWLTDGLDETWERASLLEEFKHCCSSLVQVTLAVDPVFELLTFNTIMNTSIASVSPAMEANVSSEPLYLSFVMQELKVALKKGRPEEISTWSEQLEDALVDGGPSHVQLCEAGGMALDAQRFEIAERFAKRSLLAFPKYGHVYRLLGEMFKRLGQPENAAPCYRFVLPQVIRERWFSEGDCIFVDSTLKDGANIERRVAFATENHSLKQPLQTNPVSVPDLDHSELISAEAYVGIIPGGRLWYDGGNATAWDRQGRIVEDLGMGYAPLVHASVAEQTPIRLKGRVCLLGNRSWLNYYHWMCDSMPRLDVLEAAGIDLDSIDHFVVMEPKYPFHTDSLTLAGIGEDRLHTTGKGQYIEADELLMPVFGSNSLGLAQGSWTARSLAHRFGPTKPVARNHVKRRWFTRHFRKTENRPVPGSRLFVSRGTTGKRGVANEPALLKALAPLGFEAVRCETLSITEQAELFASAEVVLGPHGAGLTNIVFCAENTLVVELFNAHMAACFWTISELTGLRHALHYCAPPSKESARLGSDPGHTTAAIDVRLKPFDVDIDALLGNLEELGVSARHE